MKQSTSFCTKMTEYISSIFIEEPPVRLVTVKTQQLIHFPSLLELHVPLSKVLPAIYAVYNLFSSYSAQCNCRNKCLAVSCMANALSLCIVSKHSWETLHIVALSSNCYQ